MRAWLIYRTHAALEAEHVVGGSHYHPSMGLTVLPACCKGSTSFSQQSGPPGNHCHCLCPKTKAEGTLHLCSVSLLPLANMLRA